MKRLAIALLCAVSIGAHAEPDPRTVAGFDHLPPEVQARAMQHYEASQRATVDQKGVADAARLAAADRATLGSRIQNIPGVCVGDACNNVVKIQHWDSNGNMTN